MEAEQNDVELLHAAASGDATALGTLYDRHAHRLVSLACAMLHDRGDAEDLVHDVFVEAWQRAESYDATRCSVRGWLLLRTRSRAIDRLRQRRNRPASMDTDQMPEPVCPAERPERLAEQAHAVSVLASLPPAQRRVLEQSFFEGLSCRAIAALNDLPEGTVKSRLAAGIDKLRGALSVASGEVN